MRSPTLAHLRLTLATAIALGMLALPAVAQSQSELRHENQRLTTENRDLKLEFDEAKKEIERLRQENQRLRAALSAAGGTSAGALPPLEEAAVTIDESKPEASPRALFNAAVESHRQEMGDLEMGADGTNSLRIIYMRRLEKWVSHVNRHFKTPVEWNVRIAGTPVRAGRGYDIRLQAVDPGTNVELGDPFVTHLPHSLFLRLRQREDRKQLTAVMVLKGTIEPRLHINGERLAEGTFNNPMLVGPFVEFGFSVNAHSLVPQANDENKKKDATTKPK